MMAVKFKFLILLNICILHLDYSTGGFIHSFLADPFMGVWFIFPIAPGIDDAIFQ